MPKVSVIVTSYNYGEFLCDCLNSIKDQTYKDYELVLADDGSNDDTLRIMEQANPDLLIRSKDRRGVVHINNLGVRCSSGNYICLINSDDMILPTYLERCVEVLDSRQDIAIAYTDFHHFGGGLDNDVIFRDYDTEGGLEELRKWNFILGSALFKRQAFIEAGGFSSLMTDGYEDYDLWLSICELDGGKRWRAKKTPGALYLYRNHGRNRTIAMKSKRAIALLWIKHKMFDRLTEFEFPPELIQKTFG
jgi:glycosyltransferase involved in cell wall biosynthesis